MLCSTHSPCIWFCTRICVHLHHSIVRTLFGCHHKDDIQRLCQCWSLLGHMAPVAATHTDRFSIWFGGKAQPACLHVFFSHGISCPLILSTIFGPWGHYFEPPPVVSVDIYLKEQTWGPGAQGQTQYTPQVFNVLKLKSHDGSSWPQPAARRYNDIKIYQQQTVAGYTSHL